MSKNEVNIYTDGACSGNPGPGGWAAILIANGKELEISGGTAQTTNNQQELTAAIEGLNRLKRPCNVTLYSDSAYLVSAFNNHWLEKWQRNGWKNAAGKAVSNQELWQQLLDITAIHRVTWVKVNGHADDKYNNRCDKLAVHQSKLYQADES